MTEPLDLDALAALAEQARQTVILPSQSPREQSEIYNLRREVERAVPALIERVRTAEAEVERLRDWKASASTILSHWDATFLALPREVREAPQHLGRSKARVTHDWIRASLDGDYLVLADMLEEALGEA